MSSPWKSKIIQEFIFGAMLCCALTTEDSHGVFYRRNRKCSSVSSKVLPAAVLECLFSQPTKQHKGPEFFNLSYLHSFCKKMNPICIFHIVYGLLINRIFQVED